ncbi:M56 family metallopeptidase [Larkinella rosea]|uniref:M56 family metallopeptidase n=1 Tax=Larkinella rosea TaxID=2025312 RepID=A0A3P1BC50_9BACT|nr:M56 family metallopeptidase [Larkinella rosea]RRA98667.1 M56 family metallopeptidase [Larkinella rosea]
MSLLIYLLQAGLILAVLTLCYRLLLRRATWFGLNRYLLGLNVILALVLPLVELPDFRPAPVRNLVQQTVPNFRVLDWSKLKAAPANPVVQKPQKQAPDAFLIASPEAVSLNWRQMVLWAYLAGVIFLGGRLFIQIASLVRLIIRSERTWQENVWLVVNADVSAPFSFFHWVILNPDLYEPDEFNQILAHERVHCRQWHSLDMLLAEWLRIVFWFNPFAWWHQQLVQENLEYLVDREVLAEGVEKKAYQYYLLKASLSGESPIPVRPATNSFNQPQLKNRISMMNRPRSNGGWQLYLFFCVVVTLSCSAFTVPKIVSRYVVDNRYGVFGLITAVTTVQDLEVMKAVFADKGFGMRYQADINPSGQIDHISVEVKNGNQVVARALNQIPPFVITAVQPNPSKPFVVQTTRRVMQLPDTLFSIWEHEKPVVVLNGRVLNLRPGQPFGFGSVADYKRTVLTAQEATKRFGKTGQYGATTIDGKILDAVFAANPDVMAMGRQLLYKKTLAPEQLTQFTFLVDGKPGSYREFRELRADDKISVAVFDKNSAGSVKPAFTTKGLVVVTTKRQLLAE